MINPVFRAGKQDLGVFGGEYRIRTDGLYNAIVAL